MAIELPPLLHLAEWHERLPRYAYVAALVEGRRVLDLVCGSGEGSALLRERGADEVVGVDPRRALVEQARARRAGDELHFYTRRIDKDLTLDPESGSGAIEQPDPGDVEDTSKTLQLPAAGSRPSAKKLEDDATDADPVVDENDDLDGPFDVVLALDARIPLHEPTFVAALADKLSDDGIAVVAVRTPETASLGDVLASLEFGPDSAETCLFPDGDVGAAFAEHFETVRIVGQRSRLDITFEPAADTTDDETDDSADDGAADASEEDGGEPSKSDAAQGDDATTSTEDASRIDDAGALVHSVAQSVAGPHTQLVVLRRGPDSPSLPQLSVRTEMEPIAAQLARFVDALQSRALGTEHRGLLLEEQVVQKDALIDDLEREVRASDVRRREVEAQLRRLREELDGLQGELTTPPQTQSNSALERALEDRDAHIQRLGDQLRHAELVMDRQREAIDAQRETIEALRLRLDLRSGPHADPAPEVATAPDDADEGEIGVTGA